MLKNFNGKFLGMMFHISVDLTCSSLIMLKNFFSRYKTVCSASNGKCLGNDVFQF